MQILEVLFVFTFYWSDFLMLITNVWVTRATFAASAVKFVISISLH